MQQLAESAPSPSSPSFAGLLAALAAPKQERPWPGDDAADDGLADDIATLSYERALRAHARYRRPDPVDWSELQPATPVPAPAEFPPSAPEPLPQWEAAPQAEAKPTSEPKPEPKLESKPEPVEFPVAGRNLKSVSITIRVTQAECKQLRLRAAEAGLTISSYLRSCTFEAESLRAQVKEALAQMRSAPAAVNPAPADVPSRASRSWWTRILPHAASYTAQA
jgi:Mobilization protein NikA